MRAAKRANPAHNRNMLLAQGLLNILGSTLNLLLWGGSLKGFGVHVASFFAIAAGLVGALFARAQKDISDDVATFAFLLVLLPVFGVLWTDQQELANLSMYWLPFVPHELSVLTIAMLAPPRRWAGCLGITLFPIEAALQLEFLPPEQATLIPARPLAAPIAFAAFALVLYFFRRRGLESAMVAAERDAELRTVRRFTSSILAIKDLANSPLQALLFDAELLRTKYPETREVADRILQTTQKLRDLNRVLDSHLPETIREEARPPLKESGPTQA